MEAKHLNQHSTCTSSFINNKYDCRHKLGKNTYLIKNLSCNQLHHCNVPPNHRPVCSSISQQHCHPRDGHDSPRNKGLSRLTHSQKYTIQPSQHSWVYQANNGSDKPTQLGLSSHPKARKGCMLRW